MAHRLRTIYDSDTILVLKDGSVAESGTHAELVAQEGGVYSELWNGMFITQTSPAETIITIMKDC